MALAAAPFATLAANEFGGERRHWPASKKARSRGDRYLLFPAAEAIERQVSKKKERGPKATHTRISGYNNYHLVVVPPSLALF